MEEVKDTKTPELTEKDKQLLQDKQAMEVIKTLNDNLRLSLRMSRFKSIRRAGRRNHLTPALELIPKRPFNNRANRSTRKGVNSRVLNEAKKRLYEGIKRAAAKKPVQ